MIRITKSVSFLRCYSGKCFSSTLIDIRPEIEAAIKSNGPVVALESTIITHGMPYPQNFETALEVEKIVRQENSIPATIAIINGKIKVGLTESELNALAKNTSRVPTVKTSRRDLAYVLSKGWNGGTTVAGTLIVANAVGIDVFATGGIGGVHRDGENTMDISADLNELGKSAVAVVSSGVKSILDIPKTLEYLETQGVLVAAYQSPDNDFPAFYTRKSGSKAPYNVQSPFEAAEIILNAKILKLNSGILIAVPVPEQYAMDDYLIDETITSALREAKLAGIHGKEATPFLLKTIANITEGKSLQTNIALIKNNARVASQIAAELSKIKSENDSNRKISRPNQQTETDTDNVPVVVGGSNMDVCYSVSEYPFQLNGATYHSKLQSSGGGVGRNIAEGLSKLHGSVHFISKLGYDQNGDSLLNLLPKHCQNAIERDNTQSTASCAVIFDKCGDCKLILADMDIHQTITSEMIIKYERFLAKAPIVVFDGNISVDAMGTILELCRKYRKPAFFEPTDMRIASKPFSFPSDLVRQIKFISPNIYELNAIAAQLTSTEIIQSTEINVDQLFASDDRLLEKIKQAATEVAQYIDNILLTLGPNGVLVARKNTPIHSRIFDDQLKYIEPNSDRLDVKFRIYEAKIVPNIVNVSGAGDSFNVGFIAAMIGCHPENVCVSVGMESARAALHSPTAVPVKYFGSDHKCWRQPAIYKEI